VVEVLTSEQVRAYAADGFLLVSGLIPPEVMAAAEAAMWGQIGLSPEDPTAWADLPRGSTSFGSPELLACYTPAYLTAAARLAGDPPETLRPPSRAFALNVFPVERPWEWPRPHIDHAIKEHGHRTFPRAFRVAAMTFLNDVEPHGGGTVVWPGSHHRIEALARSDSGRFELMWTLNQSLQEIDLGRPLELTPRAGDALFYHYLCAHAGSANTSCRPRFALNMKW
jgi:hypothetical protein